MEGDEGKKKLKKWLSNKNNVYLVLILTFAIIVRLYFLFMTQGQPLWWDEAEYTLKAKNIALGTPESGFWPGRPILFPVILSGFFFVGLGEMSIRFFLMLISVASIYLVYHVGKKMFNEKIGLISSLLYSLVYINLFYSMRIMIDVFHVAVGLLAFSFFFSRKRKLIWLVLPILALDTLLRFPSFFFFVILLVYVLATERLNAFKNKDYWISALLAIIVSLPYLLWSYSKYGHPLYAVVVAGGGSVTGVTFSSGLVVLKQYINSFPMYFHSVLLTLFLIGLVFFYDVILGYDLIGKSKRISYKFLTLIWVLIPLAYFGFGVSHYEDRYIFMTFPAIFFVIAISIDKIQSAFKKYGNHVASGFLIIVLLLGGWQLLNHSNDIINSRLTSYDGVKEGGLWIKDYSREGDIVLTKSHPQNTYYSERESYTFPNSEQEFLGNVSLRDPQFIVVSVYEKYPDWAYASDFSEYGYKIVKSIPADKPQLLIFEKV